MKCLRTMITMVAIMLLACSSANARTWYIKVDGSGDAPTIQAGIDSAMAEDTVLVGPGTYSIPAPIHMKSGIVLQSEQGPYNTIINPGLPPGYVYCGIQVRNVANSEVTGFWVKPFYGMGGSCLEIWDSNTITVTNNILESSTWGLYIYYSGYISIRNNLFIGEDGSSEGYGITFDEGSFIELKNDIVGNHIDCRSGLYGVACNDILGNPGCIRGGYFQLDPQFCGVSGAMNYYLQSDSPCAPGNDPLGGYCGLIGPLPVGCGTVDVEKKTWGEIKTLYQE